MDRSEELIARYAHANSEEKLYLSLMFREMREVFEGIDLAEQNFRSKEIILSIDEERCTQCAACYDVCPYYVLGQDKKTQKILIRYPEQCRSCGHCIAVCPEDAISHTMLSGENFVEAHKIEFSPDTLKEYIVQRRSIRSYKDKQVPEKALNALVEIGAYGGTGANTLSVGFTVIKDKALLRNLEQTVSDICWNSGLNIFDGKSPEDRLFTENLEPEITSWFRSYHNIFRHRQENNEIAGMVFRNAPAVILAHDLRHNPMGTLNCAVALRNMEFFAPSMGLGTCWTGYMVTAAGREPQSINTLVGLEESRQVYGGIMVGYPKHAYGRKIVRFKKDKPGI